MPEQTSDNLLGMAAPRVAAMCHERDRDRDDRNAHVAHAFAILAGPTSLSPCVQSYVNRSPLRLVGRSPYSWHQTRRRPLEEPLVAPTCDRAVAAKSGAHPGAECHSAGERRR